MNKLENEKMNETEFTEMLRAEGVFQQYQPESGPPLESKLDRILL